MKEMLRKIVAAALLCGVACAALVSAASAGAGGPYPLRGNSITINDEKGTSRTDGSLIGNWQTMSFETIAAGGEQYAGAGTELFTGCHDRNGNKKCEPAEKGSLKFTFAYWGTYDLTTGALIKGQCQHPIIGGTGAFKGARGVIYMKDTPTATGVRTVYSGTLAYAGSAASSRSLASRGARHGCGG